MEKIYPYLIDSKRMTGYYELLMEEKFKLRIFNKKKDKEIYDYFLPYARNYMFWTFNLDMVKEFEDTPKNLKGPICDNYNCNIFEKGKTKVVCFKTGVCFAITGDQKVLKQLIKYEEKNKMQEINLREDTSYDVPNKYKKYKEAKLFAFVLELYKMIYLNKVEKAMQNPSKFDVARNSYADFTKNVFNIKVSDKDDYCEKVAKDLQLNEKHVAIDNEFDLLYKNSRLNKNLTVEKIAIALMVVFIIIAMLNLGREFL